VIHGPQAVLRILDPGGQIVKIVYDELVALMGLVDTRVRFAEDLPALLVLCGLQDLAVWVLVGRGSCKG
jgi:signal recognition particle subunit SRP54